MMNKKKNIPEFLLPFENQLERYKREYIKIKAIPLDDCGLEDPLGLQTSKFLGTPFWPIDKAYPKDSQGRNMILIAQINFSDLPGLQYFPENGILQLYFSPTNWYSDEYKIFYFKDEELKGNSMTDFSFLNDKDYEESPIYRIHKLEFSKDIDFGGSEDSQFDFSFGRLDFWDFEETLNEKEKEEFTNYFDCSGHKIGGYADFTQSDPRDYDETRKNDIQLLQIDIDDYIMFGDSGIGHIFISKDNLIKLNFNEAYFYWDCC